MFFSRTSWSSRAHEGPCRSRKNQPGVHLTSLRKRPKLPLEPDECLLSKKIKKDRKDQKKKKETKASDMSQGRGNTQYVSDLGCLQSVGRNIKEKKLTLSVL